MPVTVALVAPPSVTQSGTLSSGSAVVTGLTTSALAGAVGVTGTGVPAGACVLSVDSASQVTLTAAATSTGSASLAFALQPVTLPEALLHVRQASTDDASLVAALIGAATNVCQAWSKRVFLDTTFDATFESFPVGGGYFNRLIRQTYGSPASTMGGAGGGYPGFLPTNTGVLEVPRMPLVSVTSVQYYDASGNLTTLGTSNYLVAPGSPGRIAPAYGKTWPVALPQIAAVTVRFVAGYGATAASVPDHIKAAVKLLIGHLYENRESVVIGSGIVVHELPQAVELLLSPEAGAGYY